VAERHIVGLGGGGQDDEQANLLRDYIVSLTGKELPRICHVPTAVGDAAEGIALFHARYGEVARTSHGVFFPYPRPDLREHILAQDAISVSGGNTANMLAVWRVHGFDDVLREAWERGIVLFGGSAGMICWFESSITDSFGPQLEGMRDGLGFLPGSACPHYDGEAQRRPRYRALLEDGFPAGVAADDGVALHYVGTELAEVVACRPGAAGYRVSHNGEERLDARLLA
jgi:dipeptidase E